MKTKRASLAWRQNLFLHIRLIIMHFYFLFSLFVFSQYLGRYTLKTWQVNHPDVSINSNTYRTSEMYRCSPSKHEQSEILQKPSSPGNQFMSVILCPHHTQLCTSSTKIKLKNGSNIEPSRFHLKVTMLCRKPSKFSKCGPRQMGFLNRRWEKTV